MTHIRSGTFITLEGGEGVGKTTNRQFIADWFKQQGIDLLVTREPGGTELAEKIRDLLLADYGESVDDLCEILLVFAARAQHVAQVIRPALAKGQWVLCDRFTDATYAYQGAGRALNETMIDQLAAWVHADLQPDVTFLLDAPVELGLARGEQRSAKDRFECEQAQFFNRVRNNYLQRAQQAPQRFKIIDAAVSLPQVQQQIAGQLSQLLGTVTCSD